MRPLHAAAAVLTIMAIAVAIVAGGRAVLLHGENGRAAAWAQGSVAAQSKASATAAIPRPEAARPEAHSRAVDPDVIAPPQLQAEELERLEPRAPLSDLALAGPPKPPKTKMPDDWSGTKLFQPVALAAGVIEANGYSVAISGIDIVRQDETCTDGGKSWTCGTRARTAFRAFLRGRALVCAVPPESGRDLIAAECRVGNQDVGQWLIENGWARPAESGPYVEAGEKARTAKRGIFGPAPSLSGLPPAPAPVAASSEPTQPILDPSATTATPPTDQPAPSE